MRKEVLGTGLLSLCLSLFFSSPISSPPLLSFPPMPISLPQAWKNITALEDRDEYISCAVVWIEYPAKYFGRREVRWIQVLGCHVL